MCLVGPKRSGPRHLCKFAKQLLRHGSHAAGRGRLSIRSEMLDDHRENRGERHLNDLWRDACFGRGFFDEAGARESLADLLGSGCGSLTGALALAPTLEPA